MAKDFDKTGRKFETGQPVTVDGKAGYTVIGGHEDGVSLMNDDGHRTSLHASPANPTKLSETLDEKGVPIGPFVEVEITGDAPDEKGIAALHEKWVAQADANRLAAAKG